MTIVEGPPIIELPPTPDTPPAPTDGPEPESTPAFSPRRRRRSRGPRPPLPPLSPGLAVVRAVLLTVLALTLGLLVQLTIVSSLQHRADQQALYDAFRLQLAEGTAPVGPLDADGRALALGSPVAYLQIPELDLRKVVVSGTSSGALFSGPGHRRDTVLPGQAGVSLFVGRRAAYGGPFAGIDRLDGGDEITVTTGQGEYEYRVVGVRRAGDPLLPPLQEDESRLVLSTADGAPFLPNGVVSVDAEMEGTAEPGPGRLFRGQDLPAAETPMAGDTSQLWALVLWLQVLVVASTAAVWSWHRWGRAQTWLVFLPVLGLVGTVVSNHVARLLPNML